MTRQVASLAAAALASLGRRLESPASPLQKSTKNCAQYIQSLSEMQPGIMLMARVQQGRWSLRAISTTERFLPGRCCIPATCHKLDQVGNRLTWNGLSAVMSRSFSFHKQQRHQHMAAKQFEVKAKENSAVSYTHLTLPTKA